MKKVNSDLILDYMKGLVEQKKSISKEVWLEVAFKLNLLRTEDANLLNKMRQAVAQRQVDIMQEKECSVAAAKLEMQATDEYRFMKDQEAKLYSVDEFIRIAKKNSETNW